MRVKLLTLRYSATLGGFDDTPLAEFVKDKEVLAFREHFFSVSDVPHLTCVLLCQDAVVTPSDLAAAKEVQQQAASAQASRVPFGNSELRQAWRDRGPGRRQGPRQGPDVAAGLSEPERVLFNTLRDWRAGVAREEGVPPFLVFTNRHLLEVVRKNPESANALGQLQGIGPGKVRRYGAQVLGVLRQGVPPRPAAKPPADDRLAGPPAESPESPASPAPAPALVGAPEVAITAPSSDSPSSVAAATA